MMVSIMIFGKLCSGAKTLGREHSNGSLKNDFENLGMECYSIDGFQNEFENMVGMFIPEIEGMKKFYKKALVVLSSRLEQLTHATTLPWYGMGLSPKFVCFSAGRLTLYMGL
jgi:hypothetical protein